MTVIKLKTDGERYRQLVERFGTPCEVSQSIGIGLQPSNIHTHIMCCKKDGHFVDRNRFLGDYVNGVYRFESK